MLKAVLLKLHAKFTPGWALIQVNFDHIQEIGPKVGDGCSFVSGPFIARLLVHTIFAGGLQQARFHQVNWTVCTKNTSNKILCQVVQSSH